MEKLISDFSVGLFLWQTVLFILLVVLLKKYAWGPIMQAIDEREEGIKDALDAAEKARREMENLQADNEKLLSSVLSTISTLPFTAILALSACAIASGKKRFNELNNNFESLASIIAE